MSQEGRKSVEGWTWGRVVRLTAALATVGLLLAALLLWRRPLLAFFTDQERVAEYLRRRGAWAPAMAIGLQVLQVIASPIPGQALDMVNGYLFGPLWGSVYSATGMMIGSCLAMGLTRRFGRPLARRLAGAEALERVDRVARRRGPVFFLVFFLMPFVPNDVACFLAGLTSIPLPELMLIALLGRTPSIVVSNLVGAAVTQLTLSQIAAFAAGAFLLALAFWRWQRHIEEVLMRAVTWLTEMLQARWR